MIHQITATIFLGNIDAVTNREYLQYPQINRILRVCQNTYGRYPDEDYIDILCVPFDDQGEQLTSLKLRKILHFMMADELRNAMLIHCLAGANRSSMTAAYLLWKMVPEGQSRGFSPYDAMGLVEQKNPKFAPDPRLLERLTELTGAVWR